jgi:hypothetical protein
MNGTNGKWWWDMNRRVLYIEINGNGTFPYAKGNASAFSVFFPCKNILVANHPHTIIRTEKLSDPKVKLSPGDKWELVKKAFPLGRSLNEETHIFDGCVYPGEGGDAVFLMAALPVKASDEITRLGLEAVRRKSVSRLDTIENLLFRRFCGEGSYTGVRWVMFPQGEGYRVLTMTRGLPSAAFYLPVIPEIREGALLRLWGTDAPDEAILLTRRDWAGFWEAHYHEWMEGLFSERGTVISVRDF